MTEKQKSRSVQRRKALQKGEPMPTFDKQETLRELLATMPHEVYEHIDDNHGRWSYRPLNALTSNVHHEPKDCFICLHLAPIVERGEQMLEEWREAARLMQKLPFIGDMDPAAREAIRQLNERADDVERVLLGRKD